MKFLLVCGVVTLASGALAACSNESNVDSRVQMQKPDTSTGNPEGPCAEITGAQPLKARTTALESAPPVTTTTVYVDDLYNSFASYCGGCHVDVGLGGFKTDRAHFADIVNQDWVDSIKYNNTNTVMPPPSVGGVVYSERPADDPVNALAALLQAWLDQGSPRDSFKMGVDSTGSTGPYRMSKDLADALTDLGSCLPDVTLYATEKQQMAEKDATFAGMTFLAPGKGTLAQRIGLPVTLDQTDLSTFDSKELAKFGVVSYTLNYPVWVDGDNRALRHVRVPLGQSITFDKKTQSFTIPGDTRFYKTSLQRVKDVDGSERWRKIVTLLIVVWPNLNGLAGSAAVASLFGTYAWNEDESQATLVTDPTKNGEPFRDRVVTYVSNEPLAASTLGTLTSGVNSAIALRKAHALRSYAIPGSRRCMQCHMGSVNSNFVIGFQPLQIARRSKGEGGIIDNTGDSDLDQLNRFIKYKLITGITSADDVTPLENSEAKTPRNDYELRAQGYLLANCAHCHNPVGEPSVDNPSLAAILDFQPSETGGIFQFPLERYSPRIFRGPANDIPVPYITPSLMDIDHYGDGYSSTGSQFWRYKCDYLTATCIYAPWRSLIYRGIDTPFTYSDDLALFPHMPMNTQSIDCRATRILGDWMVSIPAVLKDPNVQEYAIRIDFKAQSPSFDASPQPYREVFNGQSGFKAASAAAADRVTKYHTSPVVPLIVYPTNENPNPVPLDQIPSRYNFCPDNYDILDAEVLKNPDTHPVPVDESDGIRVSSDNDPMGIHKTTGAGLEMPADGVPDHAHWVVLDLTLVPGDWAPRRPDWFSTVVLGQPTEIDPTLAPGSAPYAVALDAQKAERSLLDMLKSSIRLTDNVRQLAQTVLPMGLWKADSKCDFASQRTVSSYPDTSKKYPAAWMQSQVDSKQLTGSEPVYSLLPGEAIHDMICANCHGVKADSSGRQALILNEMTGGRANVTDLRNGLFNPQYRQAVFSSAPLDNASVDDWAARYFTWMALGGTKQTIPGSILAIVASTRVIGAPRPRAQAPLDANMLSSAADLCSNILPMPTGFTQLFIRSGKNPFNFEAGMLEPDTPSRAPQTTLIYSNGDAMLWGKVCSVDNPPPVRALSPVSINAWAQDVPMLSFRTAYDFYDSSVYPSDRPVVDQRGNVVKGITSDNYFAWCIRPPVDPDDPNNANDSNLVAAKQWIKNNPAPDGNLLPFCPYKDSKGAQYITASGQGDPNLSVDKLNQWIVRGAVNAGLMVYLYLDQLTNGDIAPTPAYDQCSQLSQ